MNADDFQLKVVQLLTEIKADAVLAVVKADAAAEAAKMACAWTPVTAKLSEQIDNLHQNLLGNGQPGRIQIIEKTLAEEQISCLSGRKELFPKVDRIEKKQYYAAGVVGGAGFFIGAYIKYLFTKLGFRF